MHWLFNRGVRGWGGLVAAWGLADYFIFSKFGDGIRKHALGRTHWHTRSIPFQHLQCGSMRRHVRTRELRKPGNNFARNTTSHLYTRLVTFCRLLQKNYTPQYIARPIEASPSACKEEFRGEKKSILRLRCLNFILFFKNWKKNGNY